MRQFCLSVVVLCAFGCSGNEVPLTPTPATSAASAPTSVPPRDSQNWTPFTFPDWQAGIGEPLTANATVATTVIAGDICVSNIRTAWDRRASCRRYTLAVRAPGRLDLFLRWDPSAPGYDPMLVGDVVLIAPNGRFNASPAANVDEHTWALVEPGDYGVLVMSYVETNLPFQLRAELKATTAAAN